MVYRILTGEEYLRMVWMKKYAELFAQGKPIHPYSLQCKVVSILKYSSTPFHFVYPASRLVRNPGSVGKR
jgi:hypothetical protein